MLCIIPPVNSLTDPKVVAPPVWSSDLEQVEIDGIPFRLYRRRARSVLELLDMAGRWPERTYVVQGDERWTFAEIVDAVERRAAALVAAGLAPGSPALLLGWNSVDWIVAFWAVLRAGAIVVTGNAWWSDEEVRHALEVAQPALVVSDRPERFAGERVVSFEELAGAPARASVPRPEQDEERFALAMFTSGTTGLPKAALFTHRAVVAGIHSQLALTGRLPHELPDDHPVQVTLQTGPLFHIGGVQAILRAPTLGGTLVLTRGRFDPEEVLSLIERERVERWPGVVPTMALRVASHPRAAEFDLRSVRSLTLGGAPVSEAVMERMRELFPNARTGVKTGWGLTESGGQLTAASGREALERPGSVGRPLPFVDLRLLDPDEGGVGEVLARSPMQMSHYLGDAESPIDDQGWLHTGDLGRIDEEGWLWLVGRSKDLIIRGGENIASARVEQVLREHEAVADAAVVSLPDPDLGEVVGAAVVVRAGESVSAAELEAFARSRLSKFAVPAKWWLRHEPLPANDVGKVAKEALRASWPVEGSVSL